jgi:hypothetical protein
MTPSIGRIVHVKFGDKCQAAIIVKVWSPTSLNLVVFRDGSNDGGDGGTGSELTRWATSYTLDAATNGWHWPERTD